MKLSTTVIKTLVVSMIFAFAGHVLAVPTDWFNVTAVENDLVLSSGVTTNGITEGVEVKDSVLSIDLPASEIFQITPEGDKPVGATEGKTYIDVDGAVFTPTYTNDIDNTVLDGAQTALTVAYDDAPATNYYAYIGGTWKKLAGATPGEEAVDVTIELDYSKPAETNVSFKVGSTTLHDATETDVTSFPISGTQRCLSRIDLAGYGKIHSVTTSVEAAVNVTIEPTSVTYGADFTNVTITATLGGTGYDTATYSLTWNGTSVAGAVATVSGDTLTITAPIDSPAAGRASATYAINVNGAAGEQQQTVVADTRAWVTENAGNYEATGTWSNDFSYVESVANIADNTYTANSCTSGDLVTITFENLVYTELSDLQVETPGGTQGAFALADDSGTTSFYILTKPDDYDWACAAWAGGTPSTNVAYTVEMAFNYTNNTYSVNVSDGTHSGPLSVKSATEFDICVESTKVTDFVFKGSGTMTGIKGVDSLGYMAKDSAGHWYATIDEATKSGGGEFTVLRDTDPAAPAGWKFVTEDGITKLIKAAKGVFFMVY